MNEFTVVVLSLYGMLLLTLEIPAADVPERDYRRTLFGPARISAGKRAKYDDVKYFETISESLSSTTSGKTDAPSKRKSSQSLSSNLGGNNYDEIKLLLTKLLDKIGSMEKNPKRDNVEEVSSRQNVQSGMDDFSPMIVTESVQQLPTSYVNYNRKRKVKERTRKDKTQRWGKWTNWSPCSVSCGKGREIRWRHCLENCEVAETEMEEKTCQLPACGPSKLFGVIKL